MRISFFGAARKVTGSMILMEFDDEYKVLVDCGSNLEGGQVKFENTPYGLFPFDASLVNAVILTHAHIDHSGQIPNLYQQGFEGQVLCTSATMDLSEILLSDAARLNNGVLSRIEKSHKKSKKWKSIEANGLYLQRQVDEAIHNFVPIAFNQKFKFKDNAFLTFIPAGHLLGAAHVYIEYYEDDVKKTIGFSGDLGRKNYPLLVDPNPMPEVDHLICETTYGSRYHSDKGDPMTILGDIIEEACVQKQGRLIIPAFSVGRTQALLFTLNRLYERKGIKPIKVFTDSPMAKASTKVHEKYKRLLNKEARDFYDENESLFDFENLEFVGSSRDSKEISTHAEACIIISSSGMIKGGRVEYHIEKNIENPYATILLVGYVSEDSIGGKLLNGSLDFITIKDKNLSINATIKKTDIFSGHADIDGLVNFISYQKPEKLKKIFLVHGEYEAMLNFKDVLKEHQYANVEIPAINDTFEL